MEKAIIWVSYLLMLILAMRQVLNAQNWCAYRCVSKVYVCAPCEGLGLQQIVRKMLSEEKAPDKVVHDITADVILYIIGLFIRYLGHTLILIYAPLAMKIATFAIILMDLVIWMLPQHSKKQEACMGIASWILHFTAFVLL